MVSPVPEGFRTLTPHIVCSDAKALVAWCQEALGAECLMPPMETPDGKVMHAEVRIGDSVLMMADSMGMPFAKPAKEAGAASMMICVFTEDTDALFNRAVAAGAMPVMPPADMFWGDRYSIILDPQGNVWELATHIEDVPPEELDKRRLEFMQNQKPGDSC